jgi:aromatic-L-amino-acid decarboxylase
MTARVLTDGYGRNLARVGAAFDELVAQSPGDPVSRRAAWTAELSGALPATGAGADDVVAQLADVVVPNGVRLVEPGFWGWITAGATTVPTIAALAASVAGGQRYGVTAFNLLEEVSLRWLAELCGLDPAMQGVYSSGGSTANLVAMGAARQRAFEQRGIDVAADGTGGVRTAVYASAETHHTIQRAAGVLGIGRSNVRMVGTDDRQRMRPDLLREAIARDLDDGVLPIAVVGTAGTTNTGAIDPLRELGELAHEHGVWFHVDGAYGLPGILDERVAHLYDGLELADSAIVDPHKWLNAPVGVAATFVRDADLLFRAFTQEPAAYLEDVQAGEGEDVQYSLDSMGVLYSEFGVELSSPSRGVVVWSILRELGRDGVAARVSDDNGFARRLADHVRREPHLELLTEPTLSIVCFRYVADDVDDLDGLNDALLRRLQRETPYLPSSTRVDGVYAIRPCFINPRTTPELVDGFAAAAVRLGDELRATWPTRG